MEYRECISSSNNNKKPQSSIDESQEMDGKGAYKTIAS
jgi:hypothetical protein